MKIILLILGITNFLIWYPEFIKEQTLKTTFFGVIYPIFVISYALILY